VSMGRQSCFSKRHFFSSAALCTLRQRCSPRDRRNCNGPGRSTRGYAPRRGVSAGRCQFVLPPPPNLPGLADSPCCNRPVPREAHRCATLPDG
jgi:hypothetical protein